MRLIDSTQLILAAHNDKFVTMKEIIDAPTIDSVPVVMCRECVYKDTTACPAYDAPFARTSLRIKFCSEGRRREANHEISKP